MRRFTQDPEDKVLWTLTSTGGKADRTTCGEVWSGGGIGRLDWLAPGGMPSLIRTGKAPQDGIWKRDRVMLAGHSLLLGEMRKTQIDHGLVEHPCQGLVRSAEIHGVDRAQVLRIRDRIR